MSAVPTIDLLAGVCDLAEIGSRAGASLVAAGWEHRPDVEAKTPNRRSLNQPPATRNRTTRPRHLYNGKPEFVASVLARVTPC